MGSWQTLKKLIIKPWIKPGNCFIEIFEDNPWATIEEIYWEIQSIAGVNPGGFSGGNPGKIAEEIPGAIPGGFSSDIPGWIAG